MPRIVTKIRELKKLAIDRDINPSYHGLANAVGVPFETMRRTMNGAPPTGKTTAALLHFFQVPWDVLFELDPDEEPAEPVR